MNLPIQNGNLPSFLEEEGRLAYLFEETPEVFLEVSGDIFCLDSNVHFSFSNEEPLTCELDRSTAMSCVM